MADLEKITETPRTDIDSSSSDKERDSTDRNTVKRKRSKKRRNSGRSQSPVQLSTSNPVFDEKRKEDESVEQGLQEQADSPKQEVTPTQEDNRARFYEDYRKVAEEYDKEFLKKHDEDLNTTLIFAGLFSAVTSAFIIEVNSQLQPDPSGETAALLRVLIYKIDNTTFGNNVPALPQWSGPSPTIVQVQAILFASLTVSLVSAFVAMLGKQWLNRYESTDMRGTTIERIHSRQRKLGGVVGWYFDYVMESLPLMLQSALLLLGYAISRYLWEINTTIASVVLGVTLLGVTFYVFIVLAGTFSESCPYQTPAAHLFRYTFHYLRINLLPAIRSTPVVVSSFISRTYYASWSCRWLVTWSSDMRPPWYSTSNITNALQFPILLLTLVMDVYCFGRMVIRSLIAFCTVLLRRLVGSRRTTHRWSTVISSLRPLIPGQQAIKMDLQCISWILQTSLDRVIHLSAFKHLTSMPHLSNFHPTLVVDCFNIFLRCININNGKVVISQGSEELAPASASGFFRILHHLATMDPASSFLTDLQQRYNDVFPSDVDFTDLPFQSTMAKIHTLAGRFGHPRDIPWHPRTTSIQEHVPFVRSMAEAVRERYGKPQGEKVPSRILRSVLYFLSLGSISPASVVADCLTIVAIDLGCDVSDVANLDESVRVESLSDLVIHELETMDSSDLVVSKRKAINALLPYAIFLEQGGRRGMMDAILCAAKVSNSHSLNLGKFMWRHVFLYISRLFEERSPTSLDRVITLISPFVPWKGALNNRIAVVRWAAAASAIPYSEEVGQSVVMTLFQIASIPILRSHVSTDMWGWMKRRPPLPYTYNGVLDATNIALVNHVRNLGDIDTLKSYFLLVWDGSAIGLNGFIEMEVSIKEDFGGIGMEHHRKDLIEHLDRMLWQLNSYTEDDDARETKEQYAKLKDILSEVAGR